MRQHCDNFRSRKLKTAGGEFVHDREIYYYYFFSSQDDSSILDTVSIFHIYIYIYTQVVRMCVLANQCNLDIILYNTI